MSLAVTAPGESPLTCSESALLLNRYADACPCGRKRHNLAVYICQDRVTGRGWASVTPPSDVTAHGSQAKFKFHLNSQPTQPAGTSLTCNKRASPSAGLLNGNTTWMPGPTGPPTEMTRIVHRRMVCVIYHIHHLTLKLTTILMEILSIRKRIDI